MTRKRYDDITAREALILDAAVRVAESVGYEHATRELIAIEANCSVGLISRYMGTMVETKRRIVSAGLARRSLIIVGQAIANKHPKINNAPDDLKREAMAYLMGE